MCLGFADSSVGKESTCNAGDPSSIPGLGRYTGDGVGYPLSYSCCIWLFATLGIVTRQAPLSMGFSKQEYWSGLPCPSPGDLPNPGTEPASLMSSTLADGFFITSPTWEAQVTVLFHKLDTISKKYLTGNAYQSHLWNFFKCICSSPNSIWGGGEQME